MLIAGDAELPFGVGFHPYLTVGTARVDEAVLQVQAGTRLVTDERGIPTGERASGGSRPPPRGAINGLG